MVRVKGELRMKTRHLVLCALFAALTAVLSQIAIPIGPVPINLATFAVFLAGAMLGPKLGAISLGVWLMLGLCGVPVFTMFRSGPAALFSVTGGYIIGYIAAAFLVGLITVKWNPENRLYRYPVAMIAGMLAYFVIGTTWYMVLTGAALMNALASCVVPFLPGDALKIAAASILAHRLRPVLLGGFQRA